MRIPVILLLLSFFQANAQNEFAAAAFYNELRTVVADAAEGFKILKGDSIRHRSNEFNVARMLPLADSATLVCSNSLQYAIYYFETEKKIEKADERALHLREAIVKALSLSMNSKTTSATVNQHPYSSTVLSSAINNQELFQIERYFKEGKYHVRLKIFGRPARSKNISALR